MEIDSKFVLETMKNFDLFVEKDELSELIELYLEEFVEDDLEYVQGGMNYYERFCLYIKEKNVLFKE